MGEENLADELPDDDRDEDERRQSDEAIEGLVEKVLGHEYSFKYGFCRVLGDGST